MNMNLFKRGIEAVEEAKTQNIKKGGFISDFFLRDNDADVPVRFLTTEPLSTWMHTIQEGGRYKTVVCPHDSTCPHCAEGLRPSYKSMYLVVDGRKGEYVNRKGEKVEFGERVAVLTRGSDVAVIEKLNKKGKLANICLANKIGQKPAITYLFEKVDDEDAYNAYPYLNKDIFKEGDFDNQAVQDLLPDAFKGKDYYEILAEHFPVAGADTTPKVEEPTFTFPAFVREEA